jgi:hypothetical protein
MNIHPCITKAPAIGALALLAGCSKTPGEQTTEPGRDVAVTIRGANGESVRSLPLTLGDVNVTVDGRNVEPSTVEHAAIDLASREDRVAARFAVPSGARNVLVEIRFDDYGGFETTNGQAGVLIARGTSVKLDMPARAILESGRAEVLLDLAQSLAEAGGNARTFTPQLIGD